MIARENPFATKNLETIPYYFLDGSFKDLLARLETARFRAAIVGPQGSGKTTLICELQRNLETRGYYCKKFTFRTEASRYLGLGRSKRIIQEMGRLDNETVLFIDGAEQLNWLEWQFVKILSYRFGGLIITSHSAGLLPTLFQCQTNVNLLKRTATLLDGRLRLSQEALIELYNRHQGNIRHALLELYDKAAAQ